MTQVTDREILQEMAGRTIGHAGLQAEADALARLGRRDQKARMSPDLKETIQRTAKIWLPQGKKSARDAEAREKEKAFYERQTDLEDAVAAAGGERGSAAK